MSRAARCHQLLRHDELTPLITFGERTGVSGTGIADTLAIPVMPVNAVARNVAAKLNRGFKEVAYLIPTGDDDVEGVLYWYWGYSKV